MVDPIVEAVVWMARIAIALLVLGVLQLLLWGGWCELNAWRYQRRERRRGGMVVPLGHRRMPR